MKAFFEAIKSLFEDVLFVPIKALYKLEFETWWGANIINWIFISIVIGFFVYWLRQLVMYHKTNSDREDIVAHSFFDEK